MKLELLWLHDWEDIEEMRAATLQRINLYNTKRPHEALDWKTPAEHWAAPLNEHRTLPIAA